MGLQKYKELYDFSNALLKEEHERFNRIDQKAVAYLSVVTVLIGIEGACGKEVLGGCVPTTTFLQWMVLNIGILSFAMLVATWFVIFQTLRIQGLVAPPLDQEMIDFFDNQTEVNIYYHIAKSNSIAWEENRKITNRKSKALYRGYQMIIATVCLFVAIAFLYFAKQWNCVKPPTEGHKMSQSSDTNRTTEKPAPVVPPSPPPPAPKPEPAPDAALKPDVNLSGPRYVALPNSEK